jgi:AraC family transcriptional regulator
MSKNSLHIKNMVCDRCIQSVASILNDLKIKFSEITLGRIQLSDEIDSAQKSQIEHSLKQKGFELILDKSDKLINRIKSLIIELIHGNENLERNKSFSEILSAELNYNYSVLSNLFSKKEGMTISRFILNHKVEKAKELLSYGELNISEVSQELDFSSPQHFAREFKKIAHLTPSQFTNQIHRQKLDTI